MQKLIAALLVAGFAWLANPPAIAHAGEIWNCKLNSNSIKCDDYANNRPAILVKKIDSVINLSSDSGCRVTDLDISGETNSNTLWIDSISLYEEYNCAIGSDHDTKLRRVSETAHSNYYLNCREALFKFRSMGFDYYSDGSRRHWESRTAGMPWKPIKDEPARTYVQKLFGILCR